MSDRRRPVFDACAVLALIQNETGADRLTRVAKDAIISAVSVAEVLAKLCSKGMPLNLAIAAVDALYLEVVPFDPEDSVASAGYLGKNISLGDRCFLACAAKYGTGWTSGHELGSIRNKRLPPLKMFR